MFFLIINVFYWASYPWELPDSLLSILLVPVLKDKAGQLNSIVIYRPIALSSIPPKVLEQVLITRLDTFRLISDNHFGLKKKHGTDMYIFALKEMVAKYVNQNSTVFMCV